MNQLLKKLPSLNLLQKEIYKKKYARYVEYVHRGNWILAKHLELVCNNIESIINRQIKQNILIISMPPQHGKSQCVTETLPSWYLGKYPSKRVIEISYGDDLAQRFGRRNKEKIIEFGKDIFDIELSKASDTDFEIKTHKGSMISKGIMAGLTGNPADLIIIDDPIKNRQEAESETYRNRIWEEFLNSIYTRLSADGIIILIMTRWHEDDLAGRLLESMKDKCLEVNIPLEAEEGDILNRNIGEALFPEIGKGEEWLKEFKKVYTTSEGSRSWNALMQGRPTAQEGNLIKRKWIKYYSVIPDRFDQVLQSWDCTFKDSDGSDFVVGTVWGRVGADKYLLDLCRARMNLPDTITAIRIMSKKWKDAWMILIEDKANGSAIIQMLQKYLSGIVPIQPLGSKLARLQAVMPNFEAGNIYLPDFAEWTNDYINELVSFPSGKHDDQVDSTSQALIRMMQDYSTYRKVEARNPETFFDLKSETKGDLQIW